MLSVWVFTADRAGVVRAIDDDNFIRFYIDVIHQEHVLDLIVGGESVTLASAVLGILPNTWYMITYTQTGTTISVAIDGFPLLTTSYSALSAGVSIVYTTIYFCIFPALIALDRTVF